MVPACIHTCTCPPTCTTLKLCGPQPASDPPAPVLAPACQSLLSFRRHSFYPASLFSKPLYPDRHLSLLLTQPPLMLSGFFFSLLKTLEQKARQLRATGASPGEALPQEALLRPPAGPMSLPFQLPYLIPCSPQPLEFSLQNAVPCFSHSSRSILGPISQMQQQRLRAEV